MTEDWAAVSRAIIRRMAQLTINQRELVDRSGVSRSIVREIQHNLTQRKRGDRTLADLSRALEWHAGYLDAVLHGQLPQSDEDAPVVMSTKDLPGRLSAIEYELRQLNDRVARIDSSGKRLDGVTTDIKAGVDRIEADVDRIVASLLPDTDA